MDADRISTIDSLELANVARGLGFEVISGQEDNLRLCGNEVNFSGTLGECAAFLVGWGTLRMRLLGELHAPDVQALPAMLGQASARGVSVATAPPQRSVRDNAPQTSAPQTSAPQTSAPQTFAPQPAVPAPLRRGMLSGSAPGWDSYLVSDVGERALDRLLSRDRRQAMVTVWAEMAFGREEAKGLSQRGLRLLEEAIEAFQACGGEAKIAHELVTFIFKQPCGLIGQELGGVAVSLLALAAAAGFSADVEECREIHRVLSKPLEEFTRRNAVKNAAGFKIVSGPPLEVSR